MLRIPNPPDPDVPVGGEDASVIVRTLGRTGGPCGRRLDAQAPLGGRRGARHVRPGRPAPRSPARGSPSTAGAGSALQRSLIDFFLDLHTARARHDRDLAAGSGQRGVGARHRADPGQGRPDVRRHARRPLPRPDRRGACHQHPPRRDHRGRAAAHPLRRLLALLPSRGRRGGSQDARHPAGAPVRQGRDGLLREACGLGRHARVAHRRAPRSASSGSAWPTG